MQYSFKCPICSKELLSDNIADQSRLVYGHLIKSHSISRKNAHTIVPLEYHNYILMLGKESNNLTKLAKLPIIEQRDKIYEIYGENTEDMFIDCKICGVMKTSIVKHIKTVHNIDTDEYINTYHSPVIATNTSKKLINNTQGISNPMYGKGNSINSPFSKEFYMQKGADEISAIVMARNKIDLVNSTRTVSTNVDYYIDKFGVDKFTATEMLSRRQATNSVENIAIRENLDIEDAKLIRDSITNKWIHTMSLKSPAEMALINYKKQAKSISKASVQFFDKLVEYYGLDISECMYGDRGEFSIPANYVTPYGLTKYYNYDFKWNNKIIEFNGDLYHANPRKYNNLDQPFKHMRNIGNSDIFAESIWEYDALKNSHAMVNGYDVFVVWEYDTKYDITNTLKLCKSFLNMDSEDNTCT